MHIHVFQAGKSRGDREVDFQIEVQHAALRVGGKEPCEIIVPGLPDGPVAEIRVVAGNAVLQSKGGAKVAVGGREVGQGGTAPLGGELLLTIGDLDLVYRSSGGNILGEETIPALPGEQARPAHHVPDRPSAVAKGMLKEVYAALGIPEDHPAIVVYDADNNVVKRVDLVPPEEDATIGRGQKNRVVLYSQRVSKEHARVHRDGLGFMIEDLGSRNGTLLNGQPVKGKVRLRSGDRLQIGQFTIRFVDPKAAVEDLSSSVPDLKNLGSTKKKKDQAGERSGASKSEGESSVPSSAFAASLLEKVNAEKEARKDQAQAEGEEKRSGVSLLLYGIIGLGALTMVGLAALIVLLLR